MFERIRVGGYSQEDDDRECADHLTPLEQARRIGRLAEEKLAFFGTRLQGYRYDE